MSLLLNIQKQLDVANERVAVLEQALAQHPGYPSIAANLESAVRIRRKLEVQLAEATAALGETVQPASAADSRKHN